MNVKLEPGKTTFSRVTLQLGMLADMVVVSASVGDRQPALDADPDFANAAMQAIRLWEYSPTRLNGVPMEVQIEVTVSFVAEKK
jgi:hypothetical protein